MPIAGTAADYAPRACQAPIAHEPLKNVCAQLVVVSSASPRIKGSGTHSRNHLRQGFVKRDNRAVQQNQSACRSTLTRPARWGRRKTHGPRVWPTQQALARGSTRHHPPELHNPATMLLAGPFQSELPSARSRRPASHQSVPLAFWSRESEFRSRFPSIPL